MSTHTPGPWEIHGEHHHNAYIHGANKICTMTVPQGFYRTPKESEANARLIAAAPELLEALKSAVRALQSINEQIDGLELPIDDLTATITKAGGDS